jgi:hypothetical protein
MLMFSVNQKISFANEVRNSKFDREEMAQIQATEKNVVIFEVRSPKGIRSALRKLPDYLITDDLRASIIEKY